MRIVLLSVPVKGNDSTQMTGDSVMTRRDISGLQNAS